MAYNDNKGRNSPLHCKLGMGYSLILLFAYLQQAMQLKTYCGKSNATWSEIVPVLLILYNYDLNPSSRRFYWSGKDQIQTEIIVCAKDKGNPDVIYYVLQARHNEMERDSSKDEGLVDRYKWQVVNFVKQAPMIGKSKHSPTSDQRERARISVHMPVQNIKNYQAFSF